MTETDDFVEVARVLADVLDPVVWDQMVNSINNAWADQVVTGAVDCLMSRLRDHVDDPDALAEHFTRVLHTEVVDVLRDAYDDAGDPA